MTFIAILIGAFMICLAIETGLAKIAKAIKDKNFKWLPLLR